MTPHLSPDDYAAALDGSLDRAPAAHLGACASCRDIVAELKALSERLKSIDAVPEPSPFFWEQLSRRVRASTAAERVPRSGGTFARPLAVAGALAAAIVLVLVWGPSPDRQAGTDSAPAGAVAEISDAGDDASWSAITEMASAMSADDVRSVTASAPDTAAIADLTPNERETFVRLLKLEMGGVE